MAGFLIRNKYDGISCRESEIAQLRDWERIIARNTFPREMNVYDQAKCIFSLIRMDNSIFKGYFESKVVYLLHIHKSTEFYI